LWTARHRRMGRAPARDLGHLAQTERKDRMSDGYRDAVFAWAEAVWAGGVGDVAARQEAIASARPTSPMAEIESLGLSDNAVQLLELLWARERSPAGWNQPFDRGVPLRWMQKWLGDVEPLLGASAALRRWGLVLVRGIGGYATLQLGHGVAA